MPEIYQEYLNEAKKNYKLMISSGFYEVKAYAPQIPCLLTSLKALDLMGIDYTYNQLCGDSYVDRCKNSLVHHFLKSDYTHLMILDSDETWETEGFLRLVKASLLGCEIVAGLYPCKNNWEFYGGVAKYSDDGYVMGKEIGDVRLIEMEIAPGGFLIYSRKAFERTRHILDSYVDPENNESILEVFNTNIEFEDAPRLEDDELSKMTKTQLIDEVKKRQRGGREGRRIGEDIFFQQRYKEAGGKIYCEPNISMGHFGIKEWKGNFQDYLLKKKAESEVEQAVGTTEDETGRLLGELSATLAKVKKAKEGE